MSEHCLNSSRNSYSGFIDGAIITTGANVVMSALGIFTGVAAARLLGPNGRGELAAIQAWPSALASFAMLGTSEALVYFSAKEPEKRAVYLTSSITIGLMGAMVFSLAGYMAMPWLLSSQRAEVVWGARIFLLQIWLYVLLAMPGELLHGSGRFLAWNSLRICPMLLWALIYLVAWLADIHRAVPLAIAYAFLAWVMLFALVPMLRQEIAGPIIPGRTEIVDTLAFGLPAVATVMPKMLNLRLDQILMAGLLPPQVLGLYVIAVAWSQAGTAILGGMSSIVVPRLAGDDNRDGPGAILVRVARMSVIVAGLIAAVLIATAHFGIMLFFGQRFASATFAARILAVAGALSGFNMVMSEGVRGCGRPAAALRAELAGLVVTVICLWLLLRPFGIVGAAVASLLAYGTTALWLLLEARTITGIEVTTFVAPRWSDFITLAECGRKVMPLIAAKRRAGAAWLRRAYGGTASA